MSKQDYLDMCEQLGNEPIESEIPVEFDDFPLDVQQALNAYKFMRDEWDGMKKFVEVEYKKDSSYLKKYSDDCLSKAEGLIDYARRIKKQDVSILSNEELGWGEAFSTGNVQVCMDLQPKCQDNLPDQVSEQLV